MLQIPNIGVREGVPHQPLPHQAETDRDGSPALSHRETNKNLVPEQVSASLGRFKKQSRGGQTAVSWEMWGLRGWSISGKLPRNIQSIVKIQYIYNSNLHIVITSNTRGPVRHYNAKNPEPC